MVSRFALPQTSMYSHTYRPVLKGAAQVSSTIFQVHVSLEEGKVVFKRRTAEVYPPRDWVMAVAF